MLNSKSLNTVAAITTLAAMSIAQAAGQPGRKTVHQPKIVASESVRGVMRSLGPSPRRLLIRVPVGFPRRPAAEALICIKIYERKRRYLSFRVFARSCESGMEPATVNAVLTGES
jgi:hypothetical protein